MAYKSKTRKLDMSLRNVQFAMNPGIRKFLTDAMRSWHRPLRDALEIITNHGFKDWEVAVVNTVSKRSATVRANRSLNINIEDFERVYKEALEQSLAAITEELDARIKLLEDDTYRMAYTNRYDTTGQRLAAAISKFDVDEEMKMSFSMQCSFVPVIEIEPPKVQCIEDSYAANMVVDLKNFYAALGDEKPPVLIKYCNGMKDLLRAAVYKTAHGGAPLGDAIAASIRETIANNYLAISVADDSGPIVSEAFVLDTFDNALQIAVDELGGYFKIGFDDSDKVYWSRAGLVKATAQSINYVYSDVEVAYGEFQTLYVKVTVYLTIVQ